MRANLASIGAVLAILGRLMTAATSKYSIAACVAGIAITWMPACCQGQGLAGDEVLRPYPRLVTAETRADPQAIAALEKPGTVFFQDDFESPNSLKKYFEIRGLKEGRAKLVTDPNLAHSDKRGRIGDSFAFGFSAPAAPVMDAVVTTRMKMNCCRMALLRTLDSTNNVRPRSHLILLSGRQGLVGQ